METLVRSFVAVLLLSLAIGCSVAYDCFINSPCTDENVARGNFYFAHDEPGKYVQCNEWGGCYEMPCNPAYNCIYDSPCSPENAAKGKFYFPHDDPHMYVACGPIDECFDMDCPNNLVWMDDIHTCTYKHVERIRD